MAFELLKEKRLLFCNCANCGRELMTVKNGAITVSTQIVGRVQAFPGHHRPYCSACYLAEVAVMRDRLWHDHPGTPRSQKVYDGRIETLFK